MSENQSREDHSDSVSRKRMADTPRSAVLPFHSQKKGNLKKSTYCGILLYILVEYRKDLTDNQVAWIIHFSGKLSIQELLKASELSSKLITEENTLRRSQPEIERIRRNVPSLQKSKYPEKRRIGIGYRDKGALRPLFQKRELGVETFWDEDLKFLLPLSYEVVGKWITAEEVIALVGVNHFELMKNQLGENQLRTW